MTAYIIKSSVSLLLMFGLYWFLLRKEKLFVFNRVYLIFSVIFSLALPFISIPISVQESEPQVSMLTTITSAIPTYNSEQNTITSITNQSFNKSEPLLAPVNERISYSRILMLLYIAGVLLLLVRFIRNILFLSRQMRISEKITYSGQRLVLTNHQVNPFCFFNTIFVSKQDYLNNEIAEELLSHEIEHIRQSHTADVIFIELVKIIYWFNPILILYSSAIRVNHEYLADNAVTQGSSDIKSYAEKLINYISSKRNIPLTSGFNPSLTRKRLLMLTKSRSGMMNYGARIFITLNLAAALVMVLSFKPSYSQPIKMSMNPNGSTNNQSQIVRDIDGNEYKTVKIGMQVWMAENLKTTKYNDGTAITLVTEDKIWQEFNPAFCWYNNDETANKNSYGALYNWYSVNTNKLCPAGWHVPTREELWNHLFDYLSNNGYGKSNEKNEIAKSLASTQGWTPDSIEGNIGFDQASNNSSGFNGLPVGYRNLSGEFGSIGKDGRWWSSTDYNIYMATGLVISSNNSMAFPSSSSKRDGLSVRCLKDYSNEDITTLKKQRDSTLNSSPAPDFSGVWQLKQGQINSQLIPSTLTIAHQSNTVTLKGTFDFLDKKPIDKEVTYSLDGRETVIKSGNVTKKVTAEWGQTKQYFSITTIKLALTDGSIEETKCVDSYSINPVSNSLTIYFADNINPQWIIYEKK